VYIDLWELTVLVKTGALQKVYIDLWELTVLEEGFKSMNLYIILLYTHPFYI
jgi:hypothetical protein